MLEVHCYIKVSATQHCSIAMNSAIIPPTRSKALISKTEWRIVSCSVAVYKPSTAMFTPMAFGCRIKANLRSESDVNGYKKKKERKEKKNRKE